MSHDTLSRRQASWFARARPEIKGQRGASGGRNLSRRAHRTRRAARPRPPVVALHPHRAHRPRGALSASAPRAALRAEGAERAGDACMPRVASRARVPARQPHVRSPPVLTGAPPFAGSPPLHGMLAAGLIASACCEVESVEGVAALVGVDWAIRTRGY